MNLVASKGMLWKMLCSDLCSLIGVFFGVVCVFFFFLKFRSIGTSVNWASILSQLAELLENLSLNGMPDFRPSGTSVIWDIGHLGQHQKGKTEVAKTTFCKI